MATNKMENGARVEFDPDGTGRKVIVGTVLDFSARKARVQFDGEKEPESVFIKYLTVVGKASKAAAVTKTTKEPKEKKAKVPRVPKALGVVPLVRKDGEESKSIVAGADLSHYELHPEAKTPSGRPSLDIGDSVAELLRGKGVDEVISITAHKLTELTGEKVTQSALREKYSKLNPGQIRMNCGNRLRAAYKADQVGQ